MALMDNWNGQPVAVRRSRGGVVTFERWEDNVLGSPPWSEALLGQVRGYVARRCHFADVDAEALAAYLDGRISKFQSANSEDAVTYSWFGTLAVASADARRAAVQWLYDRAGILAIASDPTIEQWARVFHPNAPASRRGPELDARIDDPGVALVYIEAKWNAAVGTGKGKVIDVPDDQIVVRRDSLRNDPALNNDDRAFAVLGVSEHRPDLVKWQDHDGDLRSVTIAWLTWDELSECSEHPLADEFGRYIAWKRMRAGCARVDRRSEDEAAPRGEAMWLYGRRHCGTPAAAMDDYEQQVAPRHRGAGGPTSTWSRVRAGVARPAACLWSCEVLRTPPASRFSIRLACLWVCRTAFRSMSTTFRAAAGSPVRSVRRGVAWRSPPVPGDWASP